MGRAKNTRTNFSNVVCVGRMTAFVIALLMVSGGLGGCVTERSPGSNPAQPRIQSAEQTRAVSLDITPKTSLMAARPAYEFDDSMIRIPRGFDVRGLRHCSQHDAQPWNCLRRKIVRIFVRRNDATVNRSAAPSEAAALDTINNVKLSEWLGNMLARTNRFRVISRDDEIINEEGKIERLTDRRKAIAEAMRRRRTLLPDFVLRVDVTKSAAFIYRGSHGDVTYQLDLSSAFLDPHTREILSDPVIPETRVASEPRKYVNVNNRYYAGWDYRNPANVEAAFRELAAKGFKAGLNSLLQSIPSNGKVLRIAGNNVTLDRGIEAGILANETMILFQEHQGVLVPLAVAAVEPGRERSVGVIARWKNSPVAQAMLQRAEAGVVNVSREPVFAASVGVPAAYGY